MRSFNRQFNEMRPIEIVPNYVKHADSCLVVFGDTKVLCAATIEEKVPPFLRGTGQGWLTAEYSLLPCSTETRTEREVMRGKQSGRTHEIQRLIGRSLRASLDLQALGERQIKIDCDVIQADGGTRTASICGACVALGLAIKRLKFKRNPFIHLVGAISCGIVNGEPLLDLDYSEDSSADVDANFVMIDTKQLVEVQSSGEKSVFSEEQFLKMLSLARDAMDHIFNLQKKILLGR